ncbi:anti-sigma factor (plasmid) [Shinella sp. H4-D48]|uniref:anti-sigma factor n=1 Tax=Shinella sp. H4-D48 TaxID=2925841 RepID=UPI001F52D512|nr:anti-sigma factor [Shinella sp. H4-D48]UNK39975.1 anti-sigma factor [Shinella sp. H4-D48]
MSQDATTPKDDILAGEYVLGLLSLDARRALERRMAEDRSFAELVRHWEIDLSTFNDAYDEVSPSDAVLGRIKDRLFGEQQVAKVRTGLWNSVPFWRWLSFGTSVVAASALIYASGSAFLRVHDREYVAELSAPANAVNMLATYDSGSGRMRIMPVAAGPREEKSLELWLVPGEGDPLSLGILPADTGGDLVIPADLRDRIGEGATLAVTLEPFGGSPTGRATGPIVASGTARSL